MQTSQCHQDKKVGDRSVSSPGPDPVPALTERTGTAPPKHEAAVDVAIRTQTVFLDILEKSARAESKAPRIVALLPILVGVVLIGAAFVLASLPNVVGLSTVEFLAATIAGLLLVGVGLVIDRIEQRPRQKVVDAAADGSKAYLSPEVVQSAVEAVMTRALPPAATPGANNHETPDRGQKMELA